MNLLDIYNAIQKQEATVEEASVALGITLKDLRFRLTKWGNRLPLLLSVLDRIRAGTISRTEAADTMGVTVRQINHLMTTWKVQRPIPRYVVEHALAEVKWEIRKKYAIEYIAGSSTIEEASERADVSTRQIRRWVSELIGKHFGMVFKDLKDLSVNRRRRLANEIEAAEGLEYAKQAAIQAIGRGSTTIQEEAAARVARTYKRRGEKRV